jgi:hypothetical protein
MHDLPVLHQWITDATDVIQKVAYLHMNRRNADKQSALQAIRKAKRLLNEIESQVKLLQVEQPQEA